MLPIISEEMKSADTKEKVRAELARAIRLQILSHLDGIAAQTSERIVGIWKSFKSAHTKVLELAENDAAFREFVDTVGEGKLQRLDEVVALILPREGTNGVGKALRDGRLHTAVTQLGDTALTIAPRDGRSGRRACVGGRRRRPVGCRSRPGPAPQRRTALVYPIRSEPSSFA
jgi:hypothetical protein